MSLFNGTTGNATFNNATMRGHIEATTGSIGYMSVDVDGQLAMIGANNKAATLLVRDAIPSLSQLLVGNESASTIINSIALHPSSTTQTATTVSHQVVNNGAQLIIDGTINLRVEDNGQPNSEVWMSVTAYLKSNQGTNILLGSKSCSSRNISGQSTGQAVLDYSTTLNSVSAGNYYISVDYASTTTGGGSAYANINEGTFKSEFTAAANQSYFGRGLAVIMDANNHLYYGKDSSNTPMLTYKGKTDMPGVLAAGTAYSFGGVANSWGKHIYGVSRKSTGVYEIIHNIGHTDYFITANTQYSNPPRICSYYNKGVNSIYVRTADGWDVTTDNNFDFQITGRN